MRNLLASAMVVTMALCVWVAVGFYGSVTIDFAAPFYGLVILLTLLWAAKLFFAKTVSWKHSPVHLPVLLFLVYAAIRYLTSPLEHDSRLELFQIAAFTLVYFLAASNFHRPRDRNLLIAFLMVLALTESVYGIWQFATQATQVLSSERPAQYQSRAGGTYICPNHLAGFLEIMLALLLARIAIRRSSQGSVEQSALRKVLMVYVALVAMAGIITTLSRAGWVATTVGLLTFLIWGDWRSRAMWPRLIAGLAGISVFVGIVLAMPSVRDYVALTLDGEKGDRAVTVRDTSFGGRTSMWKATWEIIRDHPVVGTGPGTWQWFHPKYRDPKLQTHPEYAHNDILHLAADYGLVGFVLVLAALVCFYRHAGLLGGAMNSSEQRSFAIGGSIGLTMILFHSWFDFNMHIPANALLLVTIMGFTVAMEDSGGRFARVEMKLLFKYGLATLLVFVSVAGVWFITPAALAARHTYLGNGYKAILDWDGALNHYRRAIGLDPKYPEPHSKIGDILRTQALFRVDPTRKEERHDLALQSIEAYGKSLALNPYQTDVMLRLAAAYEIAGDNDGALKTYEQALAVDPQSAFNHMRLGMFYRRIGANTLAAAAFEKTSQLGSGGDSVLAINLEEVRPKQ